MARRFGATNQAGTCLWCGRKLLPTRFDKRKVGVYGQGTFCTATCGYLFGFRLAQLGKRLVPPASE